MYRSDFCGAYGSKSQNHGDTGIAHSKLRLQHRRRRWNVPLHLEARAIKAQAEISQQFLQQMHNFFRMTPGGLDAVLRESATWPELPDWLKRLG